MEGAGMGEKDGEFSLSEFRALWKHLERNIQ